MVPQTNSHDSAWLAAAVRSLASDVHRLTSRGGGDAHEVAALAGRIRLVRDQLPVRPSPLHRWLDGLEQQVEALPVGAANYV